MHIVWDWNGTLLDDTQACVNTLNLMLARRGLGTVTLEYFRDNFAFPARRFYELVGMNVPDSEWDALAQEYHDTYALQPVKLNDQAVAALELVRSSGCRQSILSALRQDKLDADVSRYGLNGYFERVFGSDNLDGASKLDRALELFAFLKGEEVVLIGDALHDKEVADALGVRCVLCSQGGHSHARLAAVAPAAHTLVEAVHIAIDGGAV